WSYRKAIRSCIATWSTGPAGTASRTTASSIAACRARSIWPASGGCGAAGAGCPSRGRSSMADVFANLGTWLHQVFVVQFDGWILLGFVAQAFFTMRFVVQWLA